MNSNDAGSDMSIIDTIKEVPWFVWVIIVVVLAVLTTSCVMVTLR